MISVKVESAKAQSFMDNLVQAQLPYAFSKAVNACAFQARDIVKEENKKSFTIRRAWVLNGWRIKTSNKRDTPIRSLLYLDPLRDFLAKFEDGGTKTGIKSLTVPLEARPTKQSIVPKRLSVRNLNIRATRTKAGKVQLKGDQKTFIAKTAANTLILQRTRAGLKTLYVFKRSVPIPASLRFYDTARTYVERIWPAVMGDALANAIRTAR